MTCKCGCGEPVSGAWNSHTQRHVEYRPGHSQRGATRSPETRQKMARAKLGNKNSPRGPRWHQLYADTPQAMHRFLNLHHPKMGRCEECGEPGATDYAFLKHPEPHTRNREDYAELCRHCHTLRDVGNGHRPDWALADANPAGRGRA